MVHLRFSANNKWAFFPSLGLGWVASEESFIKDLNIFSFLKVRASYGSVGNQAVGIYQTLSVLSPVTGIVNEANVTGWAPGVVSGNVSIKGNENLKWETKTQFDLGIESNFFSDRLNLTFDYYNADTKNLLLLTGIPSQTGYTQQMANVGEVSNKGLDISINSVNVKSSSFSWTTDLIWSFNKNEVVKLGSTGGDIYTHIYNWGQRPLGILRIGEPVGAFFGYLTDGIWKEDQGNNSLMPGSLAGSLKYKDTNEDGKISVEDCVVQGSGSPKWSGGFGNNFSYKGLGLNIFLSYAYGAKMFNAQAPWLRSDAAEFNHYPEIADRWDPITNPDSNVPGALNIGRELYPCDRWFFDASYIRLESVTLSYSIPFSSRMRKYFQNATINLTGLNLFCLSPYNKWGYDPVINQIGGNDLGYTNSLQGFDYGAYPRAATFTVGVNLDF